MFIHTLLSVLLVTNCRQVIVYYSKRVQGIVALHMTNEFFNTHSYVASVAMQSLNCTVDA